jgi:hypothetical protein
MIRYNYLCIERQIKMHHTIGSAAKKHDKRNNDDMTSAVGTCKAIRARAPPAAAQTCIASLYTSSFPTPNVTRSSRSTPGMNVALPCVHVRSYHEYHKRRSGRGFRKVSTLEAAPRLVSRVTDIPRYSQRKAKKDLQGKPRGQI